MNAWLLTGVVVLLLAAGWNAIGLAGELLGIGWETVRRYWKRPR